MATATHRIWDAPRAGNRGQLPFAIERVMKDFESFDEFWPYYVKEHSKKLTRRIHFAGTTAALACFVGGAISPFRWLAALAPIAGYGPAWVSHFLIEGNRPATFDYPVYSLVADLVMWRKTLEGTMDAEVERVLAGVEAAPESSCTPEIRPNMTTDNTLH